MIFLLLRGSGGGPSKKGKTAITPKHDVTVKKEKHR